MSLRGRLVGCPKGPAGAAVRPRGSEGKLLQIGEIAAESGGSRWGWNSDCPRRGRRTRVEELWIPQYLQVLHRIGYRIRALILLPLAVAIVPAQTSPAAQPAPEAVLERAHEMHQRLEQRPVSERSAADYSAITDLLARVWKHQRRVDPTKDARATPAEEALYDAAAIEIDLATDLRQRSAWQAAAEDFERLLQRFPSTLYRRNAEWALAQIDWYHRDEKAAARRYLRDFLRRYPADERAAVARRQVRGERVSQPPTLLPQDHDTAPAATPAAAAAPGHLELTAIQEASGGAGQQAAASPVEVQGLRWTTTPDSLNVIVDLSGRPEFERGTVPETHSVFYDLRGDFGQLMDHRSVDLTDPFVQRLVIAQHENGVIRLVIHEPAKSNETETAMFFPNPARLVIAVRAAPPGAATGAVSAHNGGKEAGDSRTVARADRTAARAPAKRRSEPEKAIAEARALPNGDRSLTRALGLKVGRIVLDAGHGGHDSGTIGPNGLDEKDVVLDVVLRLGRLLHKRLGTDVIYTRKDDTFIPLQERTAIANRAHADLFVSVHANSSPEHSASGIETYYLNVTHNARALDVAARENAASQLGEHELQSLLLTITSNDKRQESRALSQDLENSLARGLGEENRGVKSAPFIVLIGAHMPSVLAEISFLSNKHDARLLARGSYRQRIAESLYRGIARYVTSLGGVQAEVARQGLLPGVHEASAAGPVVGGASPH